jgi:hypothetical protein
VVAINRCARSTTLPQHRYLAARFGHDVRVATLYLRSMALCVRSFRHTGLADTDRALKEAHEIGQATTLMPALLVASMTHVVGGNYAEADALTDELIALTNQTGSLFWGGGG